MIRVSRRLVMIRLGFMLVKQVGYDSGVIYLSGKIGIFPTY